MGENTFREECRGLSGVITQVMVHLPPHHPWSRVETNRRPPLPFFLALRFVFTKKEKRGMSQRERKRVREKVVGIFIPPD